MELEYRYSESTVKPSTLEFCGDTVYLRTDISEITRENEQGNKTSYWIYQESKLTREAYEAYISLIMSKNAINSVNIPNNVSQLIVGQENVDNNQLILMSAIADLYDVIASLM